jgi:ABC-type amino acid transport substrate-binding protein
MKTTLKKTLQLLIACAIALPLAAQTGVSKLKDVQQVKDRTLIVVLEEVNEKLNAKLKPEEQEMYKKDVEEYNGLIKEAAPAFWKFSTKIEYKTRSETDQIVKAKSKDYAYLEYNKYTVNFFNPAAFRATMANKNSENKLSGRSMIGGDYKMSDLNIRLSDENPLGPPVYGVHLTDPFPNKADLAYGLKQIQLQLEYKLKGMSDLDVNKLYKTNGKKLSSVTLLVDQLDTDMKIEDIKKAYPYPVEVVTKDKIDAAQLAGDTKYAIAVVIPYPNSKYSFMVVDAATGEELGRSSPEWNTGVGVRMPGNALSDAVDAADNASIQKLKKDDFKYFAKYVK